MKFSHLPLILITVCLSTLAPSQTNADSLQGKTDSLTIGQLSYIPNKIDCCFLYIFAKDEPSYNKREFVFVSNLVFDNLDGKNEKDKTAFAQINGRLIQFTATSVVRRNKTDLTEKQKLTHHYKSEEGYELTVKINNGKNLSAVAVATLTKDGKQLKQKMWGRQLLN